MKEERRFRYLDHIADTRFIAYGKTTEEVFENSALAMFNVIADVSSVGSAVSFPVELTSPDIESLMVDWLSELLFLFDAEGTLLAHFSIAKIVKNEDGSRSLEAEVSGEPVDPSVHDMRTEVKAVTYNGLRVEKTEDGMEAEVVLDL
ncbi:archease [Methanosarcinaceae archaeon]|nr:archease [Methanosarcinaceae archaeon]